MLAKNFQKSRLLTQLVRKYGNASAETKKFKFKELDDLLDTIAHQEKKGETTITLIRHGQSWGNHYEMVYGSLDYNLTPLGLKQCLNVKNSFKGLQDKFYSVNSSDLIRAYLTGGITLGIVDESIDELHQLGELTEINHIESIFGTNNPEFKKLS